MGLMDIDLRQHLDNIEADVRAARRALEDEHEGNLRNAVDSAHSYMDEAYRLVHSW